jgi:hypothetical protein
MPTRRNDFLPALLLVLLGCQREPVPGALDRRPTAEAKVTVPEPATQKLEPPFASDSRLQIVTWDLGIVAPRTESRHTYTIQNASPATWTVKNITPSCSCTCGEFTRRVIKPSETASVDVVFRAGDRDGDVYQAIMVEFAETVAPAIQLAMKGEIRSLLSPSPSFVDFGRVSTKLLNRSILLRNFSDQDVVITKIDGPDWLQTEAQPVERAQSATAPRQTWRIDVRADLGKFKATEAAALVVHTNAARIDPIVIPVRVERRPPLEVIPNRLEYGDVPVTRTRQQALLLDVAADVGDLSEKDIVLTHNLGDELQFQVVKISSQNRFRLLGIFRPQRSTGAVQGELEIKVRGKTVPPLQVPISAIVR